MKLLTTKKKFKEELFKALITERYESMPFLLRMYLKFYYFILSRIHKIEKNYGLYFPIKRLILVNLERFKSFTTDENKLIKNLCDTITHETLHYAIDYCMDFRKSKIRYKKFSVWKRAEEKIVEKMMYG